MSLRIILYLLLASFFLKLYVDFKLLHVITNFFVQIHYSQIICLQ